MHGKNVIFSNWIVPNYLLTTYNQKGREDWSLPFFWQICTLNLFKFPTKILIFLRLCLIYLTNSKTLFADAYLISYLYFSEIKHVEDRKKANFLRTFFVCWQNCLHTFLSNKVWYSSGNACIRSTDYGHTKAKSLILCGPNSNPNPN